MKIRIDSKQFVPKLDVVRDADGNVVLDGDEPVFYHEQEHWYGRYSMVFPGGDVAEAFKIRVYPMGHDQELDPEIPHFAAWDEATETEQQFNLRIAQAVGAKMGFDVELVDA